MQKPGPKENLIEGQEKDLNEMFYRDYMTEYFDAKIGILVNLLSEAREITDKMTSKELSIGKVKFKIDEKINNDSILKFAKCEIVETYYHCLETFMRLFIAHASFEKCPLMELTTLNISEYHEIINKIAIGNFEELNRKFDGEDTIVMVLIGVQKSDKQINAEQLKNLKEWIIFCALELSKIKEYNSFKHGLSMFVGHGGMAIKNSKNMTISKEGDAIHILESRADKNQYKFNLTNVFVEYDYKVTLIMFFNEMIKNIINIGKIRYVTKEKKKEVNGLHFADISYNELNKIFERNCISSMLGGYSMQFYYKDDLHKN